MWPFLNSERAFTLQDNHCRLLSALCIPRLFYTLSSKCVPLFGSALRFSTAFFNLRPGLTTITGTGECDRQYLCLKMTSWCLSRPKLGETITHLLTLPILTFPTPKPCCTIDSPRPETKPKRLLPRVPTTRESGR